MDRTTFFKHLRRSRLQTSAEIAALEGRFAQQAEALPITQALTAEGVLTPFQARRLLSGKSRRLVLGQYRLLDELGRGGMGQVYRALHTVMGRIVAVKVISPELVKDPHILQLFQREVKAATHLAHPNIVMAYDANEAEGIHFLVMEYVQGMNLDTLIKRQGPLPIALACDLMRQAVEGLQFAHQQGVVHRDVKPGNLLASPGDHGSVTLKVLDFGLARLTGGKNETIAVRTGCSFLGTPDFIAPEQAHDVHKADVRSDLYSLGCSFYFVLTGRVPFPGETAMEKLIHHAMDEPEPIERFRPHIPAPVAGLIRRLMRKDPAERFQEPAELIPHLLPWCGPEAWRQTASKAKNTPAVIPPRLRVNVEDETDVDGSYAAYGETDVEDCWQEWSALVQALAQGSAVPVGVTEESYRSLHQRLVAACRTRAARESGEERSFYRQLTDHVAPWLSLTTLARADREILSDLMLDCQQIDRTLGVARANGAFWRSGILLAATVFGSLLIGWAVMGGVGSNLRRSPPSFAGDFLPDGLSSRSWLAAGLAICMALLIFVLLGRSQKRHVFKDVEK